MQKVTGFLAAAVLGLVPATAANAQLPPPAGPVAAHSDVSAFPDLVPGDNIEIACEAVEKRAADSDVRVVLTISAVPGESAPGYQKVLATDEQLLKDAVRVRIPELPTLEDHTVGVDVYVVGSTTAQHCDGGRVKIS
ncbi:MAG TPA: hypothetical protein VMF67_01045 [Rhizomicrobium sp.]|nr:hypothetical protein [Rhizomicrobium sp.]